MKTIITTAFLIGLLTLTIGGMLYQSYRGKQEIGIK